MWADPRRGERAGGDGDDPGRRGAHGRAARPTDGRPPALRVGACVPLLPSSPRGGLIPSHAPYKRRAILKARGNSAAEGRTACRHARARGVR